jgi:hypothetical protein
VGDYQFLDYNNDGVLDMEDRHPIKGSLYPPITYSLSSGFSYKNFDFNLMLQGNHDKYVFFGGGFQNEFNGGDYRVHEAQLDYWTPTNPNAGHPTLNYVEGKNNKLSWSSDGKLAGHTWRNGDYLRLKEVYMAYNLKSKLLKTVFGINNLNIYATGNNLLTFTTLIEGDPERKDFIDGFYPLMINGKLGLKISF